MEYETETGGIAFYQFGNKRRKIEQPKERDIKNWIYNTPEGFKDVHDESGVIKEYNNQVQNTNGEQPTSQKLKRFKLENQELRPLFCSYRPLRPESRDLFTAEIDQESTIEDIIGIAHKLFNFIAFGNTFARRNSLDGCWPSLDNIGIPVYENVLTDENSYQIVYSTFSHRDTKNHYGYTNGTENRNDIFLLEKYENTLKGREIKTHFDYTKGGYYHGRGLALDSITQGGNQIEYSIARRQTQCAIQETTKYQYDIELEKCHEISVKEEDMGGRNPKWLKKPDYLKNDKRGQNAKQKNTFGGR